MSYSYTLEVNPKSGIGTVKIEKNYYAVEPAIEIMQIRTAADHYAATAMAHQREVIRLNNLARQAREAADKLEKRI